MREFQERNIAPKTVIAAPSISELRDEPSISAVGANSFNKKEKICGIYKITSPSDRIYIGQALDCLKRKNNYKKIKKETCQKLLSRSILKYGFEKHKFEIIHKCLPQELNYLEMYYIKKYNSLEKGLNMTIGGNHIPTNGFKGKHHSEETKQKIRDGGKKRMPKIGWHHSEETKLKIGRTGKQNRNFGKKHTLETKLKMSLSHKGRVFSKETRKKMSIALIGNKRWKGKHHSEETLKKMRGRKHTQEEIEKQRAKTKGVPKTEEHKRKVSEGLKRYFKMKKEGLL